MEDSQVDYFNIIYQHLTTMARQAGEDSRAVLYKVGVPFASLDSSQPNHFRSVDRSDDNDADFGANTGSTLVR